MPRILGTHASHRSILASPKANTVPKHICLHIVESVLNELDSKGLATSYDTVSRTMSFRGTCGIDKSCLSAFQMSRGTVSVGNTTFLI
jgi:hypothetical protein